METMVYAESLDGDRVGDGDASRTGGFTGAKASQRWSASRRALARAWCGDADGANSQIPVEKCRHRHFDSIAGGDVVDDGFVPVQSLGPSANVRGNFIAPKFQCAETRTEWIMNRLRTFAIIVSAVSCVLSACATTQSNFSSEDTLTPGIFLEPEPRTALPPGVELRNPGVELRKPGVELRKVYNQGLQLTKSFEGFRGRLYNDAAGYCTIAYGHVVKLAPCDGSEPDEFLNGVSEPRGGELLVKDLERAQRAVMTNVGMWATMNLTDGQYAALCDFTFNVGGGNLKSSTLLQVINAGQFDRVPSQFRRWTMAGGKELAALKARREREIDLFFDGLPKPKAAPPTRGGEDLSPIDIRKGEGQRNPTALGRAPLASADSQSRGTLSKQFSQ